MLFIDEDTKKDKKCPKCSKNKCVCKQSTDECNESDMGIEYQMSRLDQYQEEFELFKAMCYADVREMNMMHEDASEEELTIFREEESKGIIEKIKGIIKKMWEAVKRHVNSAFDAIARKLSQNKYIQNAKYDIDAEKIIQIPDFDTDLVLKGYPNSSVDIVKLIDSIMDEADSEKEKEELDKKRLFYAAVNAMPEKLKEEYIKSYKGIEENFSNMYTFNYEAYKKYTQGNGKGLEKQAKCTFEQAKKYIDMIPDALSKKAGMADIIAETFDKILRIKFFNKSKGNRIMGLLVLDISSLCRSLIEEKMDKLSRLIRLCIKIERVFRKGTREDEAFR